MDHIAKLRAKLADQWSELDADGDGKVDAGELVSALDTNKDGVVDASEMEGMAQQLQEQSDYTAYLIAQLQTMEEKQLALQQEVNRKDDALRQTFAAADKARAEASEAARRLEISQEVLQKMSEQCKQARVEAGSLRRESQRLHHECEALRRSEAELRREVAQQRQRLEAKSTGPQPPAPQKANASPRPTAADTSASSSSVAPSPRPGLVVALQQQLEAATASQGQAEAEAARLRLDIAAGQAALLQLGEEAQHAKDETAKVQEELAAAQQQLEKVAAGNRDSAATAEAAKTKLAEEKSKVALLQQQVSSARDQLSLKDMELSALQQRLGEQTKQLRVVQAEHSRLQRELEDVGVDYLAQAKARAEEKARAQHAVREAREDRNRIAAEARRREKAAAQASAERTAEFRTQLGDAQDELARVRGELGIAQDQVAQLQQQQAKTSQDFEAAVATAQERAERLQGELDDATEATEAVTSAAKTVIASMNDKMLEARKNSVLLAEKHVGSLSALQEALHALGGECAVSRDDFSQVATTLAGLQRTVLAMNAQQHRPLDDWYSSVKHTFLSMLDSVAQAEEELEDAKDEAAHESVRVEEARQDNLMLQEQVSQLEHKVATTAAALADAQEAAAHNEETLRAELSDEKALRETFQDQVKRQKSALAEATDRVHKAQADAVDATGQLSSKHAQHSDRVSKLEEALAAARKEVRVKEQLYQAALAGKRAAEAQSSQAAVESPEVDDLKATLSRTEEELAGSKAEANAAKAQLSRLSKDLTRAHGRMQQTQALLMTVREQKQLLEDELAKRRNLDDAALQHARDVAATQPAGLRSGALPSPKATGELQPALGGQSQGRDSSEARARANTASETASAEASPPSAFLPRSPDPSSPLG